MHLRIAMSIFFVTAFVGTAMPLPAQSLADLAKKADESRKGAKGKVYTNKDVGDIPPAAAPQTNAATDAPATTTPAGTPASGAVSTTPDAAADKSAASKDQAAWAERMKMLRGKLDRDRAFAAALQSQINGLNADFVNRDDPAQKSIIEQNRNKALADLARVQKDVTADTKAISDAEEEARKSGVPAGWLR
jgi:hypothetical protein